MTSSLHINYAINILEAAPRSESEIMRGMRLMRAMHILSVRLSRSLATGPLLDTFFILSNMDCLAILTGF